VGVHARVASLKLLGAGKPQSFDEAIVYLALGGMVVNAPSGVIGSVYQAVQFRVFALCG
jgi:hypothetical protein